MALLTLPEYGTVKGKAKSDARELLEKVVTPMITNAVTVRNRYQVWWWVIQSYLQGVRCFNTLDYSSGEIEVDDFDDPDNLVGSGDSEVPFRWNELLAWRQTEIGRLLRMDPAPRCAKKAFSLQSLRDAATSQVLLDHMLAGTPTAEQFAELVTLLVDYGTAGILHLDGATVGVPSESGIRYSSEIVPPWELLCIPGDLKSRGDLRAIARTRWYPLRELESLEGFEWPTDDEYHLLDVQELQHGSPTSTLKTTTAIAVNPDDIYDKMRQYEDPPKGKKLADKTPRDREPFVRLNEVYVIGAHNTLDRYIAFAGRWPIRDQSSRGQKVPMPLNIATYDDTNQFYSKGFVERLLPGALREEKLLHRLLTNTSDFTKFGMLMVPMDQSIDLQNFKATTDPRIITYASDPNSTRDPVQQITPVNSSDIPGRVAAMLSERLQAVAKQGPMFEGQSMGRIDGSPAYQMLAQIGSTHLLTTAGSIGRLYASHYRSMLASAFRQIADSDDVRVELTRVENSVAGIVFDPTTGQVKLSGKNGIDPWKVEIGIRSQDPVSAETERDLAYKMFMDRTIKPLEFYILNYKNNWGYPVGSRSLYENYVKAVLQNLILFNDGETPGFVENFVGTFDLPEVLLFATQEFTRTAEFGLSSEAVRVEFEKRLLSLQGGMPGMLPAGAQTPDVAAAMSQAAGQQQGAGGPSSEMQAMMGGAMP